MSTNLLLSDSSHITCMWWTSFPHHTITTIFFWKITNLLLIHFLKGTYKFCWCINKTCSIAWPDYPYYSSNPVKHLKFKMNESLLNKWTSSICISLLERQVYKAPYFLTFLFLDCLHLTHFPITDHSNQSKWLAYDPKTRISYLVGDASTSMWDLLMTPSYYQFSSFTGLRQ